MTCDTINDICSAAVDSMLGDLDRDVRYETPRGRSLLFDEENTEWIWSAGGYAGPANEWLFEIATQFTTTIDEPRSEKRLLSTVLQYLNGLIEPSATN